VLPTLVLALTLTAQDPAIRVNVRLVNVTLVVRDSAGIPVLDLTKDDFEVVEDGVKQNISFFSRSADLPLTLGLIVDASGSQKHFFNRHEKDIKTFLKNVIAPRDRAFIVCFGNRLRLASDFSSSPDALIDAYKQFDKDPRYLPEIGPKELRISGTAFYDAIYHASTTLLSPASGSNRKGLVMFSDGEDNSSAHHLLDAIEAAQTENIPFFGIRYTEIKDRIWNARNKYGMSVMSRIAKETGGADFDAEKTDMKKAFKSIGEQLRSSYELAYYPSVPSDGTFRKLVIRTKRPGLTVRTKTGYYARE
jgi:Ca-activated chloride channel family protein